MATTCASCSLNGLLNCKSATSTGRSRQPPRSNTHGLPRLTHWNSGGKKRCHRAALSKELLITPPYSLKRQKLHSAVCVILGATDV
ncbi:hypothetical protein C2845_PM02G06380 [Panicum miliaceum]|uniref:Uncharacterized protein n=1 Tax=Panicum miliaceum TaxID=4540 RepID=A0A3L6SC38_PANMI|nr:hypothetical protein C2845_PM02G06380 [Panicum miliaceum]